MVAVPVVAAPAPVVHKPENNCKKLKREACQKPPFSILKLTQLSQPQHFLYFLPLPQGQGSLRPTFG